MTRGINRMYAELVRVGDAGYPGPNATVISHEGVFRLDLERSYTEASDPSLCDHPEFTNTLRAHEAPFLDCSWLMVPWLAHGLMGSRTDVFHLVRDPRDQIRSNLYIFQWEGWPWGKFARNILRGWGVDLPDNNPAVEAALYWLHWNRVIDLLAENVGAEHRIMLTEKTDGRDYANVLLSYLGGSFVHTRMDKVRRKPKYWDLSERSKRRHIDDKERNRRDDTFELTDLPDDLRLQIEDAYHSYCARAVNAHPRKWPWRIQPIRPQV
jgi:hypothetical protein